MLGLLLGGVGGAAVAGLFDACLLIGPQMLCTWVIPGVGMSIVTVLSLGFTAPLAIAAWLWPLICVGGAGAVGGGLGFLAQLLGPNAVMDMCSGTMGACVVCMDSILDCVSIMTAGILGPCTDMCSGMMGGAAMPGLPAMGGEEAAGGGGMMDMCTGLGPGM